MTDKTSKDKTTLGSLLKSNISEYGMFIALFVILIIFTLGNGASIFLSPRNVSNMINQAGYIAVLSIGMTLVIVIRHIDLSVGFVAGFTGAIAAIMMANVGAPMIVAIITSIIVGGLVGLFNGYFVAKVGIPAFIVSLAGMFIFRGALLQVTNSSTIFTNNESFNAIGNGYLPEIGRLGDYVISTLIITAVLIAGYIYREITVRNKKNREGLYVLETRFFVAKIVFICSFLAIVMLTLAKYKGISYTLLIVVVLAAIYHIMTTKTTLGRHIYAVGGNPEAARLSGINVERITLFVFASMGVLAAVSGILFTARLESATPTAGTMFEMYAIAGCYVGGVSAAGGVGKIVNSVVGAYVMTILQNGMTLMSIGTSIQYIVIGAVLVAAVTFDVKTRNLK